MGIFIDIYSIKHIGSEKYAKKFFDLMSECGLNIEKIGLFEPVKKPFTIEDAIDMWTKEEPGIYDIKGVLELKYYVRCGNHFFLLK